jgi:hypothetical protein
MSDHEIHEISGANVTNNKPRLEFLKPRGPRVIMGRPTEDAVRVNIIVLT